MSFAETTWRSRAFERRGVRRRWRAGAALSAAGLAAVLAAGLAGASPASAEVVVSHAAKRGELRGGRLILHGVSGRVSYFTDAGRSGTASVRRLHRRVFLPGKPAIGMLHVAGSHGGREPSFRLSKPRYAASRRTVSYKAKPLHITPVSSAPARASSAAPRRFGAASLSILPHPTLASGDNGGHDCELLLQYPLNSQDGALDLTSRDKWDTDTWGAEPPYRMNELSDALITSEGGLWRGCGFHSLTRSRPHGALLMGPRGQYSPLR